MRKVLFIAILLLLPTFLFSQKVTFREGIFDNGMKYPLIVFSSNPEAEKLINSDLKANVANYESQDFCIGQSGFVQKTSFIQIHIYANCIEMFQSENNYFLYDLKTGRRCKVFDMINPKVDDEFHAFFRSRVKTYITNKDLSLTDDEITSLISLTVDDFTTVLESEGIQFTTSKIGTWGTNKMFISWGDIQTYLKVNYI